MVIDTSALLAVFLKEPERQQFLAAIANDGKRLLSAANLLETGIVLEARKGEVAGRELDLFLHHASFEVISVNTEQVEAARQGYRIYGKGRHPAGLNFGDCFAYALAKVSGEPLLAKGNDFSLTDAKLVDF
jgi:ribonuclease VapC